MQVLLAIVAAIIKLSCVSALDVDGESLAAVLEWTRLNGGYMNEKVEIKQISGSLYGLYAKEPLSEGEVVTNIPWNLILQPEKGINADWCERANDIRQVITKDPSAQTPYEKYLTQRSHEHVPQYWSQDAIEILFEIMADCFPTFGLVQDIKEEWRTTCKSEADKATLDALMLLQTRGEGPYGVDFIPIHDLLNHRVSSSIRRAGDQLQRVHH